METVTLAALIPPTYASTGDNEGQIILAGTKSNTVRTQDITLLSKTY